MKKCILRILAFSLLVSFLLPITVFASGSSVEVFSDTSATSYLLMDGFTGAVLSGRNADRSLPMASTTKIMTCIVALENASLSDVVEIPKEAVGVEGSSVYLSQGEKLTLEELLFSLMLESANDAAVAIALHVSDSIDDFADLMNQKAKELNMRGTNFVNPHGLPADGHYSTARDLCLLLSYGMQNDAFRVFVGTKKTTVSAPDSKKRFLANHNKLLRIYDECIGGKTGFTKEAGRCLVTAAEKNGRILVCATLGDPNDWMDHISLFEYGFSLFDEKKILSPGEISVTVPLVGGEKESVNLTNVDEFSSWMRSDEKLHCSIEAPNFSYAGIQKGDFLGFAVYSLNGKEFKRIPLIAQENVYQRVERFPFWERMIQKIRLWID